MDPLLWAALLLLLGFGLAVLEVFVPSGGMLGFLSVLAILSSIILGFMWGGPISGLIFLMVTAVLLPACIAVAFRFWPETPIGRRLLLDVPSGDEVLPDNEQRRALKDLIGKIGRAQSVMLPSGPVIIEGRTVDAVSEGVAIEAGQPVRVVEVRGNRVVVRHAEEDARPDRGDDVLSQPIDSLGLDPFDDPLA